MKKGNFVKLENGSGIITDIFKWNNIETLEITCPVSILQINTTPDKVIDYIAGYIPNFYNPMSIN